MECLEKSYWGGNGRYQKESEQLNKLMPTFGMTENNYLNAFMTLSKLYYDMYNNGGGNINDGGYIEENICKYLKPIAKDLKERGKTINFDVTMNTLRVSLRDKQKLENTVDKLIEYLKDKDLRCPIYTVYLNRDTNCVSLTNYEGFIRIRFGNKEEALARLESEKANGCKVI